jgi:glycosyltransferase involved in cell wall biosynthesis
VLPSSQENFGIAVAEALAAGLPAVLSSEVAIAAEVEAAGAGRSLPLDPENFAAAIREYASNPIARRDAGQAAARLARSAYSWPTCAERLEALYCDVSAAITPATAAPATTGVGHRT